MTVSRRTFLAGLSTAIVAAALPRFSIAAVAAPRDLPKIVLSPQAYPTMGWLTIEDLARAIRDLYAQVEALAPLMPTSSERYVMCEQIDEALWNITPAALLITVETSFEKMIAGEFEIVEGPAFGTVLIR